MIHNFETCLSKIDEDIQNFIILKVTVKGTKKGICHISTSLLLLF